MNSSGTSFEHTVSSLVYASVRDEKELQDRTVAGLRGLGNCGEDHLPPIEIRVCLMGLVLSGRGRFCFCQARLAT